MEDLIKTVQEYFIRKIVNGDYTIKKPKYPTVTIIIDDKYEFEYWTDKGSFEQYISTTSHFMLLRDLTSDEKEQALLSLKDFDTELRLKKIENIENTIFSLNQKLKTLIA